MVLHLDKEKINNDLKGAKDLKSALKTLKQHTAKCNEVGVLLLKETASTGTNYYYFNTATGTFNNNMSLSTTSTKGANNKIELFNKSDFKKVFSDTLVILDSLSLQIASSINLPLNNYFITRDSSKIELRVPTYQNKIYITSNIIKTGNYEKITLRNKSLSPGVSLANCHIYIIDKREEKTIINTLKDIIASDNIPTNKQYNLCLNFIYNIYGKPALSTVDKLFKEVKQ